MLEDKLGNTILENIHEAVDFAVSWAVNEIDSKYNSKNLFFYHNQSHTKQVLERVNSMSRSLASVHTNLFFEHNFFLVKLAAAFHDINFITEIEDDKIIKIGVKSEESSAIMAEEFMLEINDYFFANRFLQLFSQKDIDTVKTAILATQPGITLNNLYKPNITSDSSIESILMVLADLGSAGTDSQRYLLEGDMLWLEGNTKLAKGILEPTTLTEKEMENYVLELKNWRSYEVQFAISLKEIFADILRLLPNNEAKVIGEFYNQFDNSISLAKKMVLESENLTFEKIIEDLEKYIER